MSEIKPCPFCGETEDYIPVYEFTEAEKESARLAQIIAKGDF